MPLVSVLIPTHDRPDRLRRAIRSVLENGFEDFEIVVSDDGPQGFGAKIVEEFSRRAITYLRKPLPSSKPTNWSHAARHARGKYIFKLDDDDRILPGFLSRCVTFMEQRNEVGSVYTAYVTLDERTGTRIEQWDAGFFPDTGVVSGETYARGVLTNEGGYPRNHKTTSFYRREFGERLGWYDRVCEDFAFTVGLALQASVGYLPEILYESVLHESNGIHAIERSEALSLQALQGLFQHEVVTSREDRTEFQCQITRCAKAIRLFYLQYTFREQGIREGWRYYQGIRRRGESTVLMGWLCLYGTLVPRAIQQWLWKSYQESSKLQTTIRGILRLLSKAEIKFPKDCSAGEGA